MSANESEDSELLGLLTPQEFNIVSCVLIICGVLGFLVNSLTIIVFVKVPKLHCPTNVFIVALTICDLTMSVLGIPFSVASSVSNRWIFGKLGCSWYGFIMAFMGYTSIFLLTSISVERYLLITNPFASPRITVSRAMGVVLTCITLALGYALCPMLGWSSYRLEAGLISCSINWQSNAIEDVSYIVTVFIMCLLLPVGIIIFSYVNVFRTVHALARNPLWGMNSPVTKRNLNIEYRTTRNILFTVGAFLLSWSPYAVVSFWAAFGNPADISPISGTVPALIAKSSILWNPMVYVLANREYRKCFMSFFPTYRCSTSTESSIEGIKSDEKMEMVLISKSKVKKSKTDYLSLTICGKKGKDLREDLRLECDRGNSSSLIVCAYDNDKVMTSV